MRRYMKVLNLLAVAIALAGCQKTLLVQVRGELDAASRVEKYLTANPTITDHETNTAYKIQIVMPKAGMAYKIIEVAIDEHKGYKILITDPESGLIYSGLSQALQTLIQGSLGTNSEVGLEVPPAYKDLQNLPGRGSS
jgi:hypothetical protein